MKRVILTFAAVALVGAYAPSADAARRSSMAGNLLIEDVQDIFFLPHEVVNYVNYVWFDFVTGVDTPSATSGVSSGGEAPSAGSTDTGGFDTSDGGTDGSSGLDAGSVTPTGMVASGGLGGPSFGSGGILFGNAQDRNFGFGIAVHRSDFMGAQLDGSDLGTVFQYHRNAGIEDGEMGRLGISTLPTLSWLDLLIGASVSDNMDLGARLSLGSNLASSSDIDGDDSGDVRPSLSVFSFNFVGSLGYDTDSMALDASVELNLGNWSNTNEVADTEDTASSFGLGLFGRAFFAMSENIDLGVIAQFHTRSRTADLEGDVTNESSALNVGAGVGPVYHIGEVATVAAYVTLGLGQAVFNPEGDDNQSSATAFLFPGVNIAAEWHLLDWLTYRAGLRSRYAFASGEVEAPGDSGGTASSARSAEFYWSNGFGFNALEGNFNFDAMLNWPIITGGPHFISGATADMFAVVSASYTF